MGVSLLSEPLIAITGLWLTLISLMLALLSMILSVWQSILSRNQSRKLQKISENMSTKYLCEFPDYILEVSKLIDESKKELLLLCTIPIHAAFSNREGWRATKRALEDAKERGITIKSIVGSKRCRYELLQGQFNTEVKLAGNWDSWKNLPKNHQRLLKFLADFPEKKINS